MKKDGLAFTPALSVLTLRNSIKQRKKNSQAKHLGFLRAGYRILVESDEPWLFWFFFRQGKNEQEEMGEATFLNDILEF